MLPARAPGPIEPDTTVEKLNAPPGAFAVDGTVTAGNASRINHGAAALVVTSGRVAKELPLSPLGAYPCVGRGDWPGAGVGPGASPPRAPGQGDGFGGNQRGVEGCIGGGQGIAAVFEAIHG
jgi:acetyl-CoA acetyltransferase